MNRHFLGATIAIGGFALASVPASATLSTFANYSGVGGANIYWQRAGTDYTVATPATVAVPHYARVTGTSAQRAAIRDANAALFAGYNTAVANAATAAAAATEASRVSALATAGGSLFTIATPGGTTPGAVATNFTFLNPVLYALGPLAAAFTFDATASAGSVAQAAGGYVYQPVMSGTFAFTYTGATPLHVLNRVYRTGANLLSATFVGGTIIGQNGATSGSASASTSVPGETISYASDFIRFNKTIDHDFAISASAITAALGFKQYQALNSFKATTTGSFSTQPLPTLAAGAPEPASWAMLVVGFGLIGVARRRQPTVA